MMNLSNMESVVEAFNRELGHSLSDDKAGLYDAARHIIDHGGKRLRPYMLIKSCQMLRGSVSDARSVACAVEMIHNFTLIHDDIMDNDEMRHGVPTVHKKFGVPAAILAGDILYSRAFAHLAGLYRSDTGRGYQMISALANACTKVCEGQMMDMKMARENRMPTKDEYVEMISFKTGALFAASCALGGICAGGDSFDVSNLSFFGNKLGIAFQITDDLIGVVGDPDITKKPVGNDIREGKKSLPILMALEASKGTEHHKNITDAFGNSRATGSDIEKAVESIRVLGIDKKTRRIAHRYADNASGYLSQYIGRAKRDLMAVLNFVVKRSV